MQLEPVLGCFDYNFVTLHDSCQYSVKRWRVSWPSVVYKSRWRQTKGNFPLVPFKSSHRNSFDDWVPIDYIQYIPRNMHMVFALLCFVVVIHWLIFPYPSGLLHWHCGNLTIAPVPAKQPWWIRINTWCEFIMNDCITTTKQSTTKPCAYLLGYTVQQ